eukprot:EG_transcript_7353
MTHGVGSDQTMRAKLLAPRPAAVAQVDSQQFAFAESETLRAAAPPSPWVARALAVVGFVLGLRWLSLGRRRPPLEPLFGRPPSTALWTTAGVPTAGWYDPAATGDASRDTEDHVKECEVVTIAGGVVNVVLMVCKAVAGYLGHSTAMLADAAHTLGDLCGDFISYWVIRQARRPPDASHPFGHGKFESIGAFSIAVLLSVTAVETARTSIMALRTVLLAGADSVVGPGSIAAVAAVASLIAKELLFQLTLQAGQRARSQATVANAYHHRSDALTSLVALAGIGVASLGYPVFDPIAGIVVSLFIAKAGWEIGLEAFHDLTDSAVDAGELGLCERLDAVVPRLQGVLKYDGVRARKSGPFIAVSLHLHVEPGMSVAAAHEAQRRIQEQVAKIEGVRDITIAILPATVNA